MTARRLETRIHPDDRIDPGKTGPQVMRYVTVNVGESPIAWLASRGHLSPAQIGAGERLRGDYERAGLSALDVTAADILMEIGMTPENVLELLERGVSWAVPNIVLGSMVIVPVWLVIFLLRPPRG